MKTAWVLIGVIVPILIFLTVYDSIREGFDGDVTTTSDELVADSENLPVKQSGADYVDGGDSSSYRPRWVPERETPIDREQDKHIEDLRLVLKDTITQLRRDDILPGGSSCNCDETPRVDPFTGNAEPADGCRPPGWLRMMEQKNSKEHSVPLCGVSKKTPLTPYV